MKDPKIFVTRNDSTRREKCPLCGRTDRPEAPYWFVADADLNKPLCFQCIADREPKLMGAVMELNEQHRNPAEQIDHEDIMLERTMKQAAREIAVDLDHKMKF